MTRAAIFDIDGTLVDSVDLHTQAWIEALAHFGIAVTYGDMRQQIGKGGDQLLPVFVPPERLAKEEEQISTFRADLFKRDYLPKVRAFPQVPELFRRVRDGGLKVALASSGKAAEVAEYARIAGITDFVDVTASADDAERSKPQPDIFEAALAKLAPLRAADCIAIGDTPWDAIAAGRAGLRCLGVLCGGFTEPELREAGAVGIYDGPADLLARFGGSPLAR